MSGRRRGLRAQMVTYNAIGRALAAAAARGPRCGCPKNEPEADPARWSCPCGAHCAECSTIPLCPECIGSIGGACGGPDAPYRPAKPGEPCGAADHEDGEPDAYEVWNATGGAS